MLRVVRRLQMNMADSERMAGVMEAAGYVACGEAADADVLVYNTCSIRDKAEQKVYSALGKQVRGLGGGGGQAGRQAPPCRPTQCSAMPSANAAMCMPQYAAMHARCTCTRR